MVSIGVITANEVKAHNTHLMCIAEETTLVSIGVITVNEALVVVTEVLLLGAIVAVPGDFMVPPVVILVKWAIGALFIPVTEGLL